MQINTALITGAYGFIGQHLSHSLRQDGYIVRRMTRAEKADDREAIYGDLSDSDSLHHACQGVDTIFHCAGHAHAFSALSQVDAHRHWTVNFEGTRNLLQAAKTAGVKRFIFLSSVKAMPEPGNHLVDESFSGEPASAYGQAKKAAEQVVLEMSTEAEMHVAILRLTMVYGPGSKGNLERMARMVKRGLFPPLPETGNHRSMVYVSDVIAAVRTVAEDTRANRQIYIVAGREAPSGRELFNALRTAYGMPEVSWSIPLVLLEQLAKSATQLEKLLGKRLPFDEEILDRLIGSAWYSARKLEHDLNWQARVNLAAGLQQLVGSP